MAKGRIEQEIALKVTGAKEAKEAEKLVDKLDGQKAELTIDVDDKASKDIRTIGELVEGLTDTQKKIVLQAQTDQAERDIKKLTGQLGRAKDAETIAVKVELLGDATDRLAQMREELERLDGTTVSVDTSTAVRGLDDLDRSAKSADSSASVLANTIGNSTQDLAALGGIAGSAGVALGQMGEYMADARAAGEGFGSILRSFAGVALPIAGVSFGIGLITKAFEASKAKAKELADATNKVVDALLAAQDAGEGAAAALTEIGDTEAVDRFNELGDTLQPTIDALEALGLNWGDVVEAFGSGKGEVAAAITNFRKMDAVLAGSFDIVTGRQLYDGWAAIAASLGITSDEAKELYGHQKRLNDALGDQVALQGEAVAQGKTLAQFRHDYAAATRDAAAAEERRNDAIEAQKKVYGESATAIEDWADRTAQALQDADDWAINLANTQQVVDDLGSGFGIMATNASALKSVFDMRNAPLKALTQVQNIEQGIRDFTDFINDPNGLKGAIPDIFNPDDVNADDFLNKIAGLSGPIQQAITDAFAAAGPEAAATTAENYVTGIVDALDGKLTKEQVESLLGLSDLQATIDVAVDESSRATAQKSLELLTGLTGATPWTASIALALDAGTITPEAAQLLIDEKLAGAGVDIPTSLDPPPTAETIAEAQKYADRNPLKIPAEIVLMGEQRKALAEFMDAGGTAKGLGGIAGERGPEIIDGRWITRGPTYVPPGTRVTSRRRTTQILKSGRHFRTYDTGGTVTPLGPTTNEVHIHVATAVMGDPFAVMNAIDDGVRRAARLLPTNQ